MQVTEVEIKAQRERLGTAYADFVLVYIPSTPEGNYVIPDAVDQVKMEKINLPTEFSRKEAETQLLAMVDAGLKIAICERTAHLIPMLQLDKTFDRIMVTLKQDTPKRESRKKALASDKPFPQSHRRFPRPR